MAFRNSIKTHAIKAKYVGKIRYHSFEKPPIMKIKLTFKGELLLEI